MQHRRGEAYNSHVTILVYMHAICQVKSSTEFLRAGKKILTNRRIEGI